jgi:hypothetical protein
MFQGSNPRGGEIFRTCQERPGAHPASCKKCTGSFPSVKSGRGLRLTPHPLLVPWSRKGKAIRLLLLWAVRRVQSLSDCTSVYFTITFYMWGSSYEYCGLLQPSLFTNCKLGVDSMTIAAQVLHPNLWATETSAAATVCSKTITIVGLKSRTYKLGLTLQTPN